MSGEVWYIKTSIELTHTSQLTQRNKKQEEESNEPKLQSSSSAANSSNFCMPQLGSSCGISWYISRYYMIIIYYLRESPLIC